MKRVRPDVLPCQWQPPRNPRCIRHLRNHLHITPTEQTQQYSRASASTPRRPTHLPRHAPSTQQVCKRWNTVAAVDTTQLSPRPQLAKTSPRRSPEARLPNVAGSLARLSALHARLQLPPDFPLSTLARCLVHSSADPNSARNNSSLAILGQDLLAYYTAEHIIVHYPRLPVPIIFAAQYAYSGPATLAALRAEWGVELAAAPGPEVNRALLQFKRITPGNALAQDGVSQIKDMPSNRRLRVSSLGKTIVERRGMAGRIVHEDEFGDARPDAAPYVGATISSNADKSIVTTTNSSAERPPARAQPGEIAPVTAELASAAFVRALAGALYLHAGDAAVKRFHKNHILSRHFELHKLFDFKQPTFDLSRLCAREDFEPPIARLLSETGRLSRTPVFVVGVFSGEDKLGEGAGASLNEARVRAAAAALRAWYLYSPPIDNIMRPSDVEVHGQESTEKWIPQMVDMGEIVA